MNLSAIINQYFPQEKDITIQPFGTGLINHTWLVSTIAKKYILQRINENVFNDPYAIDENIRSIAGFLKKNHPSYLFTVPVQTADGRTLVQSNNDGCFRLFEFVEDSHAYDAVLQPQLAYEAAKQFGKFTSLLSGFEVSILKITLSGFHDLALRYRQFEEALLQASVERLADSKILIEALQSNKNIVTRYEHIIQNPSFKKRVTHHDTKISNVLFDENNKAICVIDLDTVMPGYFISDVGDMMRTYLCAASEEETDLGKIEIREEYFDAIVHGYLGEMQNELSEEEKEAFVYSGKFMIYMQALRFLTDYLNDDKYYGAKYPQHNLNRAANQLALLDALCKKEKLMQETIIKFLQQL